MRYACKTPVERHEIWDVLFVYLAILGDMIWKAIDMARALLRYQFVEDPLACHCCFWVCTGIFRRRTIFLDVHVVLPESMMIPRYFVQNTQWSSRVWEFGFYANIQTCQMDIAFFKHIRFIWHFFPHEHMLVQTPSIVPPTPGVNGRAESIQATRLYLSPVLGREEFDQNRWRVCLEDPRNLQNHRGIGIDMSQAVTPSTYSSCSEASGCERSQVHMNTYEIYETLEPCFANDSYSMQEPLFVCVCVWFWVVFCGSVSWLLDFFDGLGLPSSIGSSTKTHDHSAMLGIGKGRWARCCLWNMGSMEFTRLTYLKRASTGCTIWSRLHNCFTQTLFFSGTGNPFGFWFYLMGFGTTNDRCCVSIWMYIWYGKTSKLGTPQVKLWKIRHPTSTSNVKKSLSQTLPEAAFLREVLHVPHGELGPSMVHLSGKPT